MSGQDRVVVKTDTLQVEALPRFGGKISSLCALPKGVELLQKPLASYADRTMEMAFEDGEASGFDECLPSVSACEIMTAAGKVSVPDHGDFWRLSWKYEQRNSGTWLGATGVSVPVRFEKTLRLEGNELTIEYSVHNPGESPLEYVWSAHPLFAVDEGDRIVLPSSVRQVTVEGSGGNRLGSQGATHLWPKAVLPDGTEADLSVAGALSDEIGDKLYAAAPVEGWCALERRAENLRIEVKFDPALSPYLGLWLCYGGWPEGKNNRQYCVALEPCTAPGDSLATAMEKGWARKLSSGEEHKWWIKITVSDIP